MADKVSHWQAYVVDLANESDILVVETKNGANRRASTNAQLDKW